MVWDPLSIKKIMRTKNGVRFLINKKNGVGFIIKKNNTNKKIIKKNIILWHCIQAGMEWSFHSGWNGMTIPFRPELSDNSIPARME